MIVTGEQLVVRDVERSDEGAYMCQINTDPMKSQVREGSYVWATFPFPFFFVTPSAQFRIYTNISSLRINFQLFFQVAYLRVVVPPQIEPHTDGNGNNEADVMVSEGSSVRLTCKPKGFFKLNSNFVINSRDYHIHTTIQEIRIRWFVGTEKTARISPSVRPIITENGSDVNLLLISIIDSVLNARGLLLALII